jgi:methylmalonyl-CoA/ethylmalonyl-CoA epimerase
MQVQGIAQLGITTQDQAAATRFYRDVVGLPLLFESNGMAFFQCGPSRILVGTESKEPQKVLAYLKVDDVRLAAVELRKKGVTFHEGPHIVARLEGRDVWLAAFRDPAGVMLHFMSEN